MPPTATPEPTVAIGAATPASTPQADCTGVDISEAQFRIDGAAREQKVLAEIAAKRLARALNSAAGKKFARQIILDVNTLYLSSWNDVWAIPGLVATCENAAACVTVSLASEFNLIANNSEQLLLLTRQVSSRLIKIKSLQSYAKLVSKKAKFLHDSNLKVLAALPKSHTSCPG